MEETDRLAVCVGSENGGGNIWGTLLEPFKMVCRNLVGICGWFVRVAQENQTGFAENLEGPRGDAPLFPRYRAHIQDHTR